jgi:hypothetical protein
VMSARLVIEVNTLIRRRAGRNRPHPAHAFPTHRARDCNFASVSSIDRAEPFI